MARELSVPSPALLHECARREAAALQAHLAAAEEGQSVHGARRRIKQLRSLLRLLHAELGEQTYGLANAALRKAADALAGHRRAEALVAAAARLEGGAAGAGLWCGLAQAHRAAHAAQDDRVALDISRQAITDVLAVLASTSPGSAQAEGPALVFLADYRKARRLLRKGFVTGDTETRHAARKFVIHHLHHLKIMQPQAKQRLAELEALREVLGDLNDLDELKQLASDGIIHGDDARRMRKARRHLLRKAEDAAGKLFRWGSAKWRKRMSHAAAAHSPERLVALQAEQ